MAETSQNRPSSRGKAPDPARSYERAKPEAESGMGRLDNNQATPTNRRDKMGQAVRNKQSSWQINAEDQPESTSSKEPQASMRDEEPMGWDLAPTDIHDPRSQRHPRTEGKGGTP